MQKWIYDAWNRGCKKPFGAVSAGSEMRFCVYPPRDAAVTEAKLFLQRERDVPVATTLRWAGLQSADDIYSCTCMVSAAGLYFYWFELKTRQGITYLCRESACAGNLSAEKKEPFQLTVFDPAFETPDWLKGGVLYQILPDRFCREGAFPAELPQGRELIDEWGAFPEQFEGKKYRGNCFFGGNFEGITQKFSYLKSLGVTAIYLNPIFESHSYHRYNTADYKKIDPLLGRTQDFAALCAKARGFGIRIILDGVFNHTGDDSVYFNRYGRYSAPGAFQSQDSEFFGWYDFKEWPEEYHCWWDIPDLPVVNKENAAYREFITGDGGVAAYWLNRGAAGWRLDVADELPDAFLEALRLRIKQTDPEAVLYGEVWEDASNKISYGRRRHYFEGAQLDSVMNYPWRNAVIDYLKTANATSLAESVMTLLEHYPKPAVDILMNLLGTHDSERLITALAGESAAGKDTAWKQNTRLSKEQRALGLALVRLASVLQFFLPGVPCVYYGDEAGMEGYGDPFNRRCYPWGDEDTALLSWYQKLSALRAACPALKTGGYRQLAARGGLFAFARTEGDEVSLICAVNAGGVPEKLFTGGRICLGFGGAALENGALFLPAKSCTIVGIGPWCENRPAV